MSGTGSDGWIIELLSTMETTTILSIAAAVVFLLGLVAAVVAFLWWQRVRGFVQTAEKVEGTIIELAQISGTTYAPVVEFTDHFGQRREHRAKTGTSVQRGSVGDKVQILYERNDPDSTKINHWVDLYLWPGIIFIQAVGFFFMAVVLFVVAMVG
jgi:hypothetical protein